jgi:anti-sigma factor RsiW
MRSLSCREVVELVTDYLEDDMADERRDLFERHLAICGACQRYLEQMRTTIGLTGMLREEDVPPEVMGELVAAFRGWQH